jgi:hypothetical protein
MWDATDPPSETLPSVFTQQFFIRGKSSLQFWARASLGIDPNVATAFRTGWDKFVVSRLSGKSRASAVASLGIIIAACKDIHAGTLSATLCAKLSKEVMYLCDEAAYGASVAAGVSQLYEADLIPHEHAKKLNLRRLLDASSGGTRILAANSPSTHHGIPSESELRDAEERAARRPFRDRSDAPRSVDRRHTKDRSRRDHGTNRAPSTRPNAGASASGARGGAPTRTAAAPPAVIQSAPPAAVVKPASKPAAGKPAAKPDPKRA